MRKNLFYGVFAALTLGLAACSSDDLVSITDQKVEHDQTQYIAVQISAPRDATTRAFEDGTTNESNINRLDFFFYDVAGNPTSTPLTMLEADMKAGGKYEGTFADGPTVNEGTEENPVNVKNVTRIFTTVVPVALTQGQNLPSQLICIVNGAADNINALKTVTLSDLINVTRASFRNTDFFVMTNSVYYGQDVLTGQAEQRLCATPINANSQLFGTEDAAKTAITNAATAPNALVDVYVERLAAKIGLTMGAAAVQPYVLQNGEGTGTISLTFTPEYWTMNATDNKVYLTKRYGVETTTTTGEGEDAVTTTTINRLPNYDQINKALIAGGFENWNDPTHYRSYWGCSPSYFENNYPDVSDDVNDLDGHTTEYGSTYYTYNEIAAEAARTDAQAGKNGIGKQALSATSGAFSITNTGNAASGYIYTRETTVAKKRINDINSSNPAAAVASAVLVGKYKVTGVEGNATTFYIDRNAGTGGTYYSSKDAAIAKLASRQGIVFEKITGTGTPNNDIFELKHPSKAVRDIAGTKLAGRLVALQLKGVPVEAYYYNINKVNEGTDETGGYERITAQNINAVNAQLLSAGYMDMFTNGLAFFSVPIRHLNWKNGWYTQNANGGGTYDWAAMESGSLGVVRNHVYSLIISSIKGLGTALRDADQPIVPAKEEANQYIAARLNILAWNIANTWSVDL